MNAWNEIIAADATITAVVRKVALGATPHEVEDIKSNVVLWLGTKLAESYDPARGVPVQRFIAMVAHSRAVEYMRARRFNDSLDGADASDSDVAPLSERIADESADDAFQMIARKDQRAELLAAFRGLSDAFADFAVDAFIDDMSVSDLAAKYDISEKTVYSRKCKVKAMLVAELG